MGCPPSYEEQQGSAYDTSQRLYLEIIQTRRVRVVRTKQLCKAFHELFTPTLVGEELSKEFELAYGYTGAAVELVSSYDPAMLNAMQTNSDELYRTMRQEELYECILNTSLVFVWNQAVAPEAKAPYQQEFEAIYSLHLKHREEDRQDALKPLLDKKRQLEVERIKANAVNWADKYQQFKEIPTYEHLSADDPLRIDFEILRLDRLSEAKKLMEFAKSIDVELTALNAEIARIQAIPELILMSNRNTF